VRTLGGVAHWLAVPGIPSECEISLLQGLTAHFGSEELPRIHHVASEALGTALGELIERGEPGQAHSLLLELDALVSFRDSREPWRTDALAWLWDRLAQPAALARVLELLHTSNPETLLTELIPYLEKVGTPAAQALVEVLGEEQDRKRRARLMEVIRGLGGLALPAVTESLESPKWYLVRNTLNLMADMGDMAALKPAEACLAHRDVRVRCAAVRTVWKVGGPASLPALIAAFGHADPDTLLEIMFAFGQIRSSSAVPTLGNFACDRRMPEKLRARAAETLGTLGDPSAIPFLEELVRRKGRIFTTAEPTGIRVAACKALATLGTPVAMGALKALVAKEPRNSDRPLLLQVLEKSLP
jgi:HEAT repeat protein